MKRDFFYLVLGGFVGGIFFRSFFDFGKSFSIFFFLISFVLGIFYHIQNKRKKKQFQLFLFAGVLFFSVGLGMIRFDFVGINKDNLILEDFVGQKIKAKVLVVDEPNNKEFNTQLTVKLEKINFLNDDLTKNNQEKMVITVQHYPRFKYGDELEIFGKLQKPKNFNSDDNRVFDYISYLAKDGIYYQMFYPDVDFISSGNGNFIKEFLFNLKKSFISQIKKVIPEPQSSLLGGLVVGAKESLGKKLQDDFRKVGLIHIVVLSGYNLTIVADFIMAIFSFLPSLFSIFLGAIGIILFALMTGASATIVRASVMALLVMIARVTGRTSQMTRVLFLAGFLMLFYNPNILVFDPSFQLSFMATFGLIVLSPKIEKYFYFIPRKFELRESLVAVISTQIFVLPLILYMMGDFSVVAILVNLLVLIFIPMTMLFGFLTGVIGFVSFFLSMPFAYLTYLLLSYELKVVEIFASLPFSSFHISFFPAWLMFSVYIFYAILFFIFSPTSEPAT